MNCPTCGEEIPSRKHGSPLLFCERCLAAKSYRDLLNFERQFMPAMLKGDYQLTLTRPAEEQAWHMVMTHYPQLYCGRERGRWKNSKRVAYPQLAEWKLCQRCEEVFNGLAAEVR